MMRVRWAAAGITAALVAGLMTGAPSPQAPAAEAATVAGSVKVAIKKPKITKNLPYNPVVKNGKTVTLKVKAKGVNLKYQWYYSPFAPARWKKVAGAAGKRSYLKVKGTIARSGAGYYVKVSNSKGSVRSRVASLNVRSSIAHPFVAYRQVALSDTWMVQALADRDVNTWGQGKSMLQASFTVYPRNGRKQSLRGHIKIGYRGGNGVYYPDLNVNGTFYRPYGNPGINTTPRSLAMVPTANVVVPTSAVKGGRWVVWELGSKPVTHYFVPGSIG